MALDINPDANIAVVVNRNSNSISVIDLATNTVKRTIQVGTTPTSVAINPRTNMAVVTNFGSNDISIVDLDASEEEVIATIPVGNSPRDVAIDPQSNVAIVANLNDGSVSLIDLGTNGDLLTAPIQVGNSPVSVAFNPINHTALVANYEDGTVSIIDMTQRIRLGNVSVGSNPVDITVNYEINRALVANQGSNDVSVIKLTDNSVVATVAVGSRPYGVAINPKTKLGAALSNATKSISLIYLGNGFDGDLNNGHDDKNLENGKLTTLIESVGENPIYMVINPANNTALLANLTADNVSIAPLAFFNFLPFALDNESVRSNLVINNLSGSDTNVQVELHAEDGSLLATGAVQVIANGFRQFNNINRILLNRDDPSQTNGLLKLVADQPISSFISLIDNQTNDPSLQPGRASGHAKLFLNSVINAGVFRSQLVIMNVGNTTATVKLTARDEIAAVLGAKEGIAIPANGFYMSEDIFSDLGISGRTGSVVLESPTVSPLVAVSRVVSSSRTSGFLEAVPIE